MGVAEPMGSGQLSWGVPEPTQKKFTEISSGNNRYEAAPHIGTLFEKRVFWHVF